MEPADGVAGVATAVIRAACDGLVVPAGGTEGGVRLSEGAAVGAGFAVVSEPGAPEPSGDSVGSALEPEPRPESRNARNHRSLNPAMKPMTQ